MTNKNKKLAQKLGFVNDTTIFDEALDTAKTFLYNQLDSYDISICNLRDEVT